MKNFLTALWYLITTFTVYVGSIALIAVILISAWCFIIGDWGLWEYATSNDYLTGIGQLSVYGLFVYIIWMGISAWDPTKKDEPEDKQSKNIYRP